MLLIAQVTIAFGGLLANVLSARGLGAEGRGQLALYLQVTYVVGTLVILGRDRSFPAVISEQRGLAAGTNDFARLLGLPCLLALAICAVTSGFLANQGMVHIVWLAAALWLVVIGNILTSATRSVSIASGEGRGYAIGMGVSQIVLLGIFLLFFVLGIDESTLWFSAYGVALAVPFISVSLARGLGTNVLGRTARQMRRIRRLGFTLVPSSTAEIITARLDRLLIPIFAGYSALGYYAVIATFTELIIWPIRHYIDSNVPKWAAEASNGAVLKVRRAVLIVFGLSMCLSLIVGVAIWLLVPVLFGTEFLASRELILPLVLGSGTYGLSRLAVGIATARGASKHVNVINIFGMMASVVLYLCLIPAGGAVGAAWASFGAYFLASCAGAVYLAKSNAKVMSVGGIRELEDPK